MSRAHRLALVVLCAAHLGAALTPCPGYAERAGHPPHAASDSHPCHELAPAQALTAPCPCGCSERSGPAPVAARLGLALLAFVPAAAPPDAFGAPAPALAGLPDPPPVPIDHVPWS